MLWTEPMTGRFGCLFWGGASALAQAIWEVREMRSPQEVDEIVSKMKVYTISDQDDAGIWIRDNFPNLFYINSPNEPDDGQCYHRATCTAIAGDEFYQNGPGHKFELVENEWLRDNVMENHGPLGAQYPEHLFIMEGDTPAYLGLIRNGLGWTLSPAYGGWGGRYQYTQIFGEKSPLWTNGRNSRDRVVADDGNAYVSDQAPSGDGGTPSSTILPHEWTGERCLTKKPITIRKL